MEATNNRHKELQAMCHRQASNHLQPIPRSKAVLNLSQQYNNYTEATQLVDHRNKL